ncbi:MAG: NUDIX hydrolase [Acidobacteriota bacterium]
MSRFKWQKVETVYREERPSSHGTELRWLVNQETILDSLTGKSITRASIRHPGICVIIPFLDPDHIAVMRQYRYSVDQELWELPAGTLNGREENGRMVPTETPEECARRELREETGFEARRLEVVADCYAMPGSNDEVIHIFAAYDLTQHEQSLDIGEVIMEVRAFSIEDLCAMIGRAEIRDAKTLAGLLLALSRRPNGVRIS